MTATPPPASTSMVRGIAVIETLIAGGVTDIVLAPGSRSAPLALAVARAERAGLIRLHVRLDERSAGYLAVGLAKGSGAPVVVITTSGTAAVNLHPAVVEASYGGVPLVALTADRPERLRGVGANQTIVQTDLFAGECRYSRDLTLADAEADRAAAIEALRAAQAASFPGPVHLNLALEEPLVDPDQPITFDPITFDLTETEGAHNRADAHAEGEMADDGSTHIARLHLPSRGLIVVGDTAGFPSAAADPRRIEQLAVETGWPIISEPSGNASDGSRALRHGPLILGDSAFVAEQPPEVVLTIGRVGLHRSEMALLRRVPQHIVIDPRPVGYLCDPLGTAERVLATIPTTEVDIDPAWFARWRERDDRWSDHVTSTFDTSTTGASASGATNTGSSTEQTLDGVHIARCVVENLAAEDALVVGPSWPVRHLSAFAGAIPSRVFANRGTSGIDGIVSTAWGIASSTGSRTVALVGDLTAIYDRNGLLAAPGEAHPALTYVVVDNDGGGIFSDLEQGSPEFAADFERVFGTPHDADLGTLLQAPGVEVITVVDIESLRSELEISRTAGGVRIIIVRTIDRAQQSERAARASVLPSASKIS